MVPPSLAIPSRKGEVQLTEYVTTDGAFVVASGRLTGRTAVGYGPDWHGAVGCASPPSGTTQRKRKHWRTFMSTDMGRRGCTATAQTRPTTTPERATLPMA